MKFEEINKLAKEKLSKQPIITLEELLKQSKNRRQRKITNTNKKKSI